MTHGSQKAFPDKFNNSSNKGMGIEAQKNHINIMSSWTFYSKKSLLEGITY